MTTLVYFKKTQIFYNQNLASKQKFKADVKRQAH